MSGSGYGRFGPLIGTVHVGHTNCKFLVYASRNAEILTCHETALREISTQTDWIEFDPVEIWTNVVACIEGAVQNLVILDINPDDLVAISVANQRETTLLWNKTTGKPLYNAIAWNDCRTSTILSTILAKNHNKINYLKSVCGLPFSNCFSALKCKWIMSNIAAVREAISNRECLFGTLDSWIIWNLTGGAIDGLHMTDVTNASRTMLMNLSTLNWDTQLCRFFQIPQHILPQIRSCAEIYGFVFDGPLKGLPIGACLCEQSGSLLAQSCLRTHQAICTYDDGCSLLVNTAQEIVDSEQGLLSIVGYQLGAGAKPVYGLEGAVAYAGSAVRWLKEKLSLDDDVVQSATSPSAGNGNAATLQVQTFIGESAILSSYSSGSNFGALNHIEPPQTDVVLVPAFSGLHSPFWKHNASGLMLGLNHRTTAQQVILAAYEAICFQTRDLIEALTKDAPAWRALDRLTVGGEFSENPFLLQLLADLCGLRIERPQATYPACLGAMIAAGLTMKLFTLEQSSATFAPPIEIFQPRLCSGTKDVKYRKWKFAVKKCMDWEGSAPLNDNEALYEDRDPDLLLRCSIPGTFYLASSIALFLVTNFYKSIQVDM